MSNIEVIDTFRGFSRLWKGTFSTISMFYLYTHKAKLTWARGEDVKCKTENTLPC